MLMQEQNQIYFRIYIFRFLYLSHRNLGNRKPLFR